MLPIDALIPDVLQHLSRERNLILEAAPGAGKTTRVPPALLDLDQRDVLVLEPRRLAARLAARFVASQFHEPVGQTVGYQVRFEDVSSARTRLRFLTEGVLTRRLLSDPHLDTVGTVVLDEFHERHLEGDLALALLRRLQTTRRPDLRLVVMSATLDTAPVSAYLGDARVLRSEGRQHPLQIDYTPHSATPLEEQVAAALGRVEDAGHVLVFLPGAYEIRRAANACASLARRRGWLVLPLHGDQPAEEQDRAVAPSDQTKVILATNVAESSITIEGVNTVIDSGLARVAAHSAWSGLPTLKIARVSQASANQRAGRAGRTGPGRAIRLYPLEDFVRRPAHDAPEVVRADLSPAALMLHAMGAGKLGSLAWLDAPPPESIRHAEELLEQLDAFGPIGRQMARYPLHPRLARLIVEAERRGVAEDGCTVAALLSAGERLPARADHATRSDLLVLLESPWEPRTAQVVRQVRRMVNPSRQRGRDENALLLAALSAFPDRVARRRQGSDLQLAAGGPAQLAPNSTVTDTELLIAVEAEDRADQQTPLVRIASGIEPDWLLDLFPNRVTARSEVVWNRAGERVESSDALMFGQIAIQQSRGAPEPSAAAAMLAQRAVEAGLERFTEVEDVEAFLGRVRFAAGHSPIAVPDVPGALSHMAHGLKSFAELESVARNGGLVRALEHSLDAASRRLLHEIAPEKIRLPGGRQVKVHYDAGQPPWIASRLQDFFGMRETPVIARGQVPLVIRLLAPSQRPVQTTSDLAGFWERLYPQVRRELGRRYPKHKWPEDPTKVSVF